MQNINSDLIRGNIDTIILKTMENGDMYGLDIIREVENKSSGTYELKQPTLYSCLKRLENKELISSFDNEKKVYIHADMHPKNIMIDNNRNLYIIDIESFSIDYFVMNVRWSVAAAFRNKENNEFFKGFINGYYNNDIPTSFNKQLIFITILNFIEHTIEFSETKDEEFITDYVSKINIIFNSVDLFSDDNILDNTKIFKKNNTKRLN